MKTIEDKLQAAFELGKIAGAAETIDDEATRDCIYGSAAALFDGLLTEAAEDERARDNRAKDLRDAYSKVVVDCAMGAFPPDPFDFVATGEMEEAPEPRRARTNLVWLGDNPEELAERIFCPYAGCIHEGDPHIEDEDFCRQCLIGWLMEEHKDD